MIFRLGIHSQPIDSFATGQIAQLLEDYTKGVIENGIESFFH